MITKARSKEGFFDDTWIYLENVQIVNTSNNQGEIEEFTQGKGHRLEFQKNAFDKNYEQHVKVFGFTKKNHWREKIFSWLYAKRSG